MKKILFIISTIPFLLNGFSFDVKMPDNISTYQIYPFFLNIYNSENALFSENQMQTIEVFGDQCRTFSGSMYSFMTKRLYYNFLNETGYALLEVPETISYDLSVVRDIYSTRLYGSLGKEDSFLNLSSFSKIYLENTAIIEHQTEFYGEYRNILLDVIVLQENIEVLGGYSKETFAMKAGLDNSNQIISKGALKLYGMFLYSDIKYNHKTEKIKGLLFFKYHLNLGLVHIVPQITYDSILTLQAGALYRVFPEASVYANYTRKSDENIITSGIKYFSDKLSADILPLYYSRDGFGVKTSIDVFYKYLKLNWNLSYSDSILFDMFSSTSLSLFGGNLIPELVIGYDNIKHLDCFLNLKIIDVNIFFGSRFFMDTKKYLIKGGFTWLFSD